MDANGEFTVTRTAPATRTNLEPLDDADAFFRTFIGKAGAGADVEESTADAKPAATDADPIESVDADPVESADAEPVSTDTEPAATDTEPAATDTEPLTTDADPIESVDADPLESADAEPVESADAEPVAESASV